MRGRAGLWLAVVVFGLLIATAFFGGTAGRDGETLDPESTGEAGGQALRQLLGTFGAVDVVTSFPPPGVDTAIILRPQSDGNDFAAIESWVREGGRAILPGYSPQLGADTAGPFGTPTERPGVCDIAALLGSIRELDVPANQGLLRVESGDRSCFGDGVEAYVVARDLGEGTVITVGGSATFENRFLDEADNAVLAVALAVPTSDTKVALVQPTEAAIAPGRSSAFELLGDRFDRAVYQAVIAFALLVIALGTRLGRPVTETAPVRIAGSELVAAVGGLLADTKRPDRAAEVLRGDARDRLARALGMAPGTAVVALADAISHRTGRPADDAMALIAGRAVHDEATLLALARDLDRLRGEIEMPFGLSPSAATDTTDAPEKVASDRT